MKQTLLGTALVALISSPASAQGQQQQNGAQRRLRRSKPDLTRDARQLDTRQTQLTADELGAVPREPPQ